MSYKKVVVVVSLSVMMFVGSVSSALACGPQDAWTCEVYTAAAGWQQAGQYTVVAGQWAVGQAGAAINSGAQSWTNSNGGAWTLPSGASAPLQGAYDTATNYAANYSK